MQILNSLWVDENKNVPHFGLPPLDHMSCTSLDARMAAGKTQTKVPIVELMSMAPGDGKTSLLYHLIATAVLPSVLGGRQAAVVMLDTDGRFSISRLRQQIHNIAQRSPQASGCGSMDETALSALEHVHVLRPQSLASTVATARSLEQYLLNANNHHSFERHIAFIALDSATIFYWQHRADTEEFALMAGTASSKSMSQPTGYVQLAAALKNASKALHAPVIFTSWHLGPVKDANVNGFALEGHSVRPSLPPPWQDLPTLRLIVQRTPVRKLPVEISLEEARQESEQRQRVVEQGRFECFVNEWGVDERTLRTLRSGLEFYVTQEGVRIEDCKD